MATVIDRKAFLGRVGALAGGYVVAGPLQALAKRIEAGESITGGGYGPLFNRGDIWLPKGFHYKIISRQGDPMNDGSPTPSRFDGMGAFPGADRTTILIRNHENKRRFNATGGTTAPLNEIDVVLATNRYDPNPLWNGGVTRLVVSNRDVVDSRAVLAGTTHNCAGGAMPWGSWITCEELFQPPPGSDSLPHGYAFEVAAYTADPLPAIPITNAGRFEHEAVAWQDGALYETEDKQDASFYRFVPDVQPSGPGELATATGSLQALKLKDLPTFDTRLASTWPGGVGVPHDVEWVPVANPNPDSDLAGFGVRYQAQSAGAAIFARTEGCWPGPDKVFFDCTTGGGTSVAPPNGNGQVFELDTAADTLTLVYESALTDPALIKPDNMVLAKTGDLFLCEDNPASPTPPNHIRGLTPDGLIFDFARAQTNATEFAGVCFDRKGKTMFVNQQGATDGTPGVTYAIRGRWNKKEE
jgi:secreted PhoX family phosphatase